MGKKCPIGQVCGTWVLIWLLFGGSVLGVYITQFKHKTPTAKHYYNFRVGVGATAAVLLVIQIITCILLCGTIQCKIFTKNEPVANDIPLVTTRNGRVMGVSRTNPAPNETRRPQSRSDRPLRTNEEGNPISRPLLSRSSNDSVRPIPGRNASGGTSPTRPEATTRAPPGGGDGARSPLMDQGSHGISCTCSYCVELRGRISAALGSVGLAGDRSASTNRTSSRNAPARQSQSSSASVGRPTFNPSATPNRCRMNPRSYATSSVPTAPPLHPTDPTAPPDYPAEPSAPPVYPTQPSAPPSGDRVPSPPPPSYHEVVSGGEVEPPPPLYTELPVGPRPPSYTDLTFNQ